MKNIINALNACCAFDIRHDPLVMAFSCIAHGCEASCCAGYGKICRILLSENKSLAQYLHDLLVYGRHEFMEKCAQNPTELQKKAVEFDLAAIRRLAGYGSDRLKALISDRCDSGLVKMLPDYEQGTFDYTADYFLDLAAKHGSGMFAKYRAFTLSGGELIPIESPDPIRLTDLKNYEAQRNRVVENTICFLNGRPAQNALLYGDRGTGKSCTVKAILNEFDGLRMVEVSKNEIEGLPALFKLLRNNPLRFIAVIDDLTFAENDDRFGVLKAALEGSLAARPENVLIYATTNRRKIIRETYAERSEDISRSDAVDESMTLADRFGLYVTFGSPNREVYLDIVKKLAADANITIPEEELFAAAERFAIRKGGRSPRAARQFVDWLGARIELGMEHRI